MKNSVLVIIPTYNERENIGAAVSRVHEAAPDVDIVIVDDNSPDGTGRIADDMASADPRLSVLHRAGKEGLGPAYLAGFAYGIQKGYEILVEMDADGSHPADTLPEMIRTLRDDTAGALGGVIGSRWVRGGAVANWPKSRELISRGGSWYARLMLGVKVRDVTAGYRVYRADVLDSLGLDTIASAGYCFQIDLTRRVLNAGYGLAEVPIVFRDRELGESKMSMGIMAEAMLKVTAWGAQRVFTRGSDASPAAATRASDRA